MTESTIRHILSALFIILLLLVIYSLSLAFISSFKAFLLSLITGIIWSSYLVLYEIQRRSWELRLLTDFKERIETLARLRSREEFRDELLGGSARRENSMILMGTIFIAAATFLLQAAAQLHRYDASRTVLALSSPILYAFWLFSIQLSTRLMNDIEFEIGLLGERIPSGYSIYRDFYGRGHGRDLIMIIRRNHWLAYFPLFMFASLSLLG